MSDAFQSSAFQNSAFQATPTTTQYLNPAGFSVLAFGTPLTYNYSQFIGASGATHTQLGVPEKVWRAWEFVYATGSAFTGFGTPDVRLYTRYVLAGGWDAAAFGAHAVRDRTSWAYAVGADYSTFGVARVQNKELHAVGFSSGVWGTAWITSSPRYVYAGGFAPLALGSPRIELGKRYVYHVGADATAFGLTGVTYRTQSLGARGSSHALFGGLNIACRTQRLYPVGFFGAWNGISYGYEYQMLFGFALVQNTTLFALGAPLTAFGTPFVDYNPRYLYPSGASTLLLGGAYQVGHTPQYVSPPGWDGATIVPEWWEWGTDAYVKFVNRVSPQGDESQVFGSPRISNWVQVFEQWNPWPATRFGPAHSFDWQSTSDTNVGNAP